MNLLVLTAIASVTALAASSGSTTPTIAQSDGTIQPCPTGPIQAGTMCAPLCTGGPSGAPSATITGYGLGFVWIDCPLFDSGSRADVIGVGVASSHGSGEGECGMDGVGYYFCHGV